MSTNRETAEPLDVQTLANALYRVWPRTFGSRMSWSQPSIEMAAAIAREYDAARGAQDVEGRESEAASLRAALDECRQHHADTLAGLDPHDLGAQKGRDELQRVHDEAADGFRWWTSAAPTEEERQHER